MDRRVQLRDERVERRRRRILQRKSSQTSPFLVLSCDEEHRRKFLVKSALKGRKGKRNREVKNEHTWDGASALEKEYDAFHDRIP